MSIESTLNVANLPRAELAPAHGTTLLRTVLECIHDDGTLTVSTAEGQRLACDWLETGERQNLPLTVGDRLLVATASNGGAAVAMGRIGRYRDPQTLEPVAHLRLHATESVSLSCGQATVDLRSDGKVMVRGDDVLLRAKGTQRIKAGTVSIN